MEFIDRLLTCTDCHGEFVFTAGEQLFFFDKQFKNDPKRCKPCKSKRATPGAAAGPAAAGISRTETRTECSECGVETTVPFKPTQGRPVLCRMCFQKQRSIPTITPQPAPQPTSFASEQVAASPALAVPLPAGAIAVLTESSLLAAQAAAANDLPIPEVTLQAGTVAAPAKDDGLNGVALLASIASPEQQTAEVQMAVSEMAQA